MRTFFMPMPRHFCDASLRPPWGLRALCSRSVMWRPSRSRCCRVRFFSMPRNYWNTKLWRRFSAVRRTVMWPWPNASRPRVVAMFAGRSSRRWAAAMVCWARSRRRSMFVRGVTCWPLWRRYRARAPIRALGCGPIRTPLGNAPVEPALGL